MLYGPTQEQWCLLNVSNLLEKSILREENKNIMVVMFVIHFKVLRSNLLAQWMCTQSFFLTCQNLSSGTQSNILAHGCYHDCRVRQSFVALASLHFLGWLEYKFHLWVSWQYEQRSFNQHRTCKHNGVTTDHSGGHLSWDNSELWPFMIFPPE